MNDDDEDASGATNAIVDGNLAASCVEHKYSKETFSLLVFLFKVMDRILLGYARIELGLS